MWGNEWIDEYPVCHDHELKNNVLSTQAITNQKKEENKGHYKIPHTA